ncbi:hypothetical protein FK531_14530 [Rhodococcus spelaei]|uniref:DUF6875 domain-containing protein n=1 Tax=Rhodococcus spelaei TaxID=2546320 RepID=A0A541B7K9_9NOCA|nr:hypothetical protein [Rhodococcus spelaei]TQF68311.1 hypothetical protein FK531_14530 [Rhodococcus spelaei]
MTRAHLTGPRSGTDWISLFDDEGRPVRRDRDAAALTRWVIDYLIEPHEELGRGGPVCPFVKQSVVHGTFWAGFVPGVALTVDQMSPVIADALHTYLELPDGNHDSSPHTLVTVFPSLGDGHTVEVVHAAFKSRFVEKGLMLGQFYPGCRQSGLWNKDFHALDAPLPMLVVRKMMSTDYPFLVGRREWLFSYFSHFAPVLPVRLRWAMAERMQLDADSAKAIADLRMHGIDEQAR